MAPTSVVDRSGTGRPRGPSKPAGRITRRSSWQLLGRRNFCLYFLGSLGSNLGTWLQNTVQVLLAYEFRHSAFFVGLVVSAQFAGTLFLSPWAAVLADRLGARRTLVGAQCASAFIAAAMCVAEWTHWLGERTLVVGALSLGVCFALALPVQTALVPSLVPAEDTESAMAMNSVSYNSGRALAPVLAVLVIAFIGPAWIFGINAISFAIFALVLRALKSDSYATGGQLTFVARDSRERAKVADGIRTARQSRRLLLLLAIVAAVTLADDPVQVLSPGIVHNLHLPGTWAAYWIAALGWGIVLGSLAPMARGKVTNPSRASQRAAWLLLSLALSVVLFAVVPWPLLSIFGAFAAGVAALFTGAATQALIVGSHRKAVASVAGLWAVAWAGTKPIASLLDGFLASHFGILTAVIVLVLPAVTLAVCELTIPQNLKERIKAWSLSGYLGSKPPPSYKTRFLYAGDSALKRLGWSSLPDGGTAESDAVSSPVGDVAEV